MLPGKDTCKAEAYCDKLSCTIENSSMSTDDRRTKLQLTSPKHFNTIYMSCCLWESWDCIQAHYEVLPEPNLLPVHPKV